MIAIAVLTELIKQATQSTPEPAASAEQPTQQATQSARERAAKATGHPTAETSIPATEHAAKTSALATQDVPEPAAGGTTLRTGAGVLEGLSRQEHHQRLDDWRGCSAAPLHRGASGSHHVAQN